MENPIKKPAWEVDWDNLLDRMVKVINTPPSLFNLTEIKDFIRQIRKDAYKEGYTLGRKRYEKT